MKMQPVESKALKAIGYSKDRLRVQHTGGGYLEYVGVPKEEFMKLLTAESVGSHYNDHIRKKFDIGDIDG